MKSNDEKISIISQLISIIKSRNLIEHEVDLGYPTSDCTLDIEYFMTMLHHRIISFNRENNDHIWAFYCETRDYIQLVFPVPPFNNDFDRKLESQLEKFIIETRECIEEILKKDPPKIVLDLRNNYGGYIFAFYDALLPLLPDNNGQTFMRGSDISGNEIMTTSEKDGSMILKIGTNHSEYHKLHPIQNRAKCQVEVWVNSRSASSSEMILLICKQAGYNIIGGQTMGLTTGMTQISHPDGNISVPNYVFVDKLGNTYIPHDSTRVIEKQTSNDTLSRVGQIYDSNILTKLPQNLLEQLDYSTSLCVFNNIHCEYFDDNYHAGISPGKNPSICYQDSPNMLYIYVPKKCKQQIKTVLSKFEKELLSGTKIVLIDIRNSNVDGDLDLGIFDEMYKPWKVTNQKGVTAYICNKSPYVVAKQCNKIGRYSSINAQFWVNKNSTRGDILSSAMLLYFIDNFGLYEKSKLGKYYKYGSSTCEYKQSKVEIYSCKFKTSRIP
jgi:hypothetical protein